MQPHDSEEFFEFLLITERSYPHAVNAANKGFEDAKLTVRLVQQTFTDLAKESMHCLCLDCETPVNTTTNKPKAIALCLPMFPSGESNVLSCVVCERCAERIDLMDRMLDSLRKMCPSATLVEAARTKQ